ASCSCSSKQTSSTYPSCAPPWRKPPPSAPPTPPASPSTSGPTPIPCARSGRPTPGGNRSYQLTSGIGRTGTGAKPSTAPSTGSTDHAPLPFGALDRALILGALEHPCLGQHRSIVR